MFHFTLMMLFSVELILNFLFLVTFKRGNFQCDDNNSIIKYYKNKSAPNLANTITLTSTGYSQLLMTSLYDVFTATDKVKQIKLDYAKLLLKSQILLFMEMYT